MAEGCQCHQSKVESYGGLQAAFPDQSGRSTLARLHFGVSVFAAAFFESCTPLVVYRVNVFLHWKEMCLTWSAAVILSCWNPFSCTRIYKCY